MSKSPSLRRIQADVRELALDPSDRYHAAPLENDMFEWHFTIRGAEGTEFEGGMYHGRILLPAEYPFKPPNIMFLTPSGRFDTGMKVCLSFSAFHPELWQPAWGIRLILEALISFLPTKGDGAIGALDWTVEERKRLAKKSVNFHCNQCGAIKDIMKSLDERVKRTATRNKEGLAKKSKFQNEIEQLHVLQIAAEGERKKTNSNEISTNANESSDTVEAENKSATREATSDTEEPTLGECKPDKTEVINHGKDSSEVDSVDKKPPIDKTIIHVNLNEVTASSIEGTATTSENDAALATGRSEVDTPSPTQQSLLDSLWFSDPISHAGIIVFSILIFMLVKKVQAIMQDIIELEEELYSTSD